MNHTAKILVTAFLFLATLLITESISAQTLEEKADQVIPELLEKHKTPGIAIAVIDNNQLLFKKGYGYSNIAKEELITGSTGFNIGSISKMFTAWGIMKLAQQGKVDLDLPVETYLTRWQIPDSEFDKSKVTIRRILSHTAGLSVHGYPGFPPELQLPTLEKSLDGENGPIRDNAPVRLIYEPGEQFKYSGGGYTILQLVIEEVSGISFSEYMAKTIFNDLDMDQTSFSITDEILNKSATPYDEELKQIYLERFTAQGAAGLHTTLDDLVVFTEQLFDENEILSPEIYSEMTTTLPITKGRYGLGQMAMKMGPISIIGHAGSNDGWESAFFVHKPTNSAIIMLTNGSNGKQVLMSFVREWVGWKASQNSGDN